MDTNFLSPTETYALKVVAVFCIYLGTFQSCCAIYFEGSPGGTVNLVFDFLIRDKVSFQLSFNDSKPFNINGQSIPGVLRYSQEQRFSVNANQDDPFIKIVLTIQKLKPEDEGSYNCLVKNDASSLSRTLILDVGYDVYCYFPHQSDVYGGELIVLQCSASLNSKDYEIELYCFQNGKLISFKTHPKKTGQRFEQKVFDSTTGKRFVLL